MPEAMPATPTFRPVVENFYATLFAKDSDLVARIIDEHFAEDAFLHRPETLPGGGRFDGADAIRKFMVAAAAHGPVDRFSVAGVIDGGDRIVVEIAFPGGCALEVWTIEDMKVTSIRAFYWDTAAMV